jgi:hypothetical protein
MMGFGRPADPGFDMDDLMPRHVKFNKGDVPFVYSDPFHAAQAKVRPDAEPDLAPMAGVKVFDFSRAEDIEELRILVQQVAWGYCRFDVFSLQFSDGVFKAFVVWTLFQKMAVSEVNSMKQRAWEVMRRIHAKRR